jgi:Bacterial Ig-like domain
VSTTNHNRRRRPAIALIAVSLLTLVGVPSVAADSTAQTLPFAQDWHDTNLITVTNDWSGVPGVVGHMGQDITTATGVNPQTLLTDSTLAGDVQVIADIPPELNIQNGGVGEFQLDDAVVAVQPDGIADAPYLLLDLQTTGFRDVAVSYVLRDLDDSIDNAVQPFALQYRVASSGPWTNIPAGFVADATTGPSLATLVTPKNVTLPAGANDQALVQVRIITANAVPRDEWVGVDDIQVAGTALDTAPAVLSTSPGDGAADVARDGNLSVTFDEPVDAVGGWFDISCATSQGHTAAVSGGPLTFTLDPDTDFAYGEGCTLTVYAQNVTDQDTDDPPNLMVADYLATFQTVAAPPDQAPGIQSTSPDNGATGVARDASPSVTFDEPVDVTAGSFSISCTKTFAHAANVTGGPLTFTLQPFNDFAYDDTCTLTVHSESVTDQDTNDPPNLMASDYTATFQTVAEPPPVDDAPAVQSMSPGDGATDIARGANLTVTFSEPVDVASGWYDIKCPSGSHTAIVSGGPLTFTLDPAVDLAYDESCRFTVHGQSVTDQDANDPPDSMSGDRSATFQTVAAPPIDDDFAFDGFRGLKNLPEVNESNLGTQFIRFSLGGDQGLDIFKNDHPMSASYPCGTTPPSTGSEPTRLQGESGFRYDAGADEYTVKWNIDKSWKNTCRVFVLGLSDGSTHNVAFHFGSAPAANSQKIK